MVDGSETLSPGAGFRKSCISKVLPFFAQPAVMRHVIPLLLLLLSACASPAPGFMGAERQDVTLGGVRFAVFRRDSEAEVIRLGYLTRKERAAVPELMMQAAAQATGCTAIPNSMVTKIPGDTGEARISLRC